MLQLAYCEASGSLSCIPLAQTVTNRLKLSFILKSELNRPFLASTIQYNTVLSQ